MEQVRLKNDYLGFIRFLHLQREHHRGPPGGTHVGLSADLWENKLREIVNNPEISPDRVLAILDDIEKGLGQAGELNMVYANYPMPPWFTEKDKFCDILNSLRSAVQASRSHIRG